ncbi:MAG: hypothetical protein Greene101415_1158 [Parcubacteria group bacterium Greene1014_15]|nr:MAG: hypothetical protein Greene101415_1158 [Parcubacteria group bacterium Greene1014_15]
MICTVNYETPAHTCCGSFVIHSSEEETRLESTLVTLNDKADEYQQLGVPTSVAPNFTK